MAATGRRNRRLWLAETVGKPAVFAFPVYENIASFLHGLAMGILLIGALYTPLFMAKIRAFKMRLLRRE